jgi:hypothetical protein
MREVIERLAFSVAIIAPVAAIFVGRASRNVYDSDNPEPPYPRWYASSDSEQDQWLREWKANYEWNENGWNYELIGFGVTYGLGIACWLSLIIYAWFAKDLSGWKILSLVAGFLFNCLIGFMMFIAYIFRYG